MKLSTKIIIPALTLLAGTSLVGSVSGTIAWYQYSTKANVAYLGTSAGTSGNLLVRIKKANQAADADWGTYISYNDVDAFLGSKKIQPVTVGKLGKDDALPVDAQDKLVFYSNPIYDEGPLNKWNKADAANFVQIPLQFKFVERDGSVDNQQKAIETQVAKDLYLSDLLIQNDFSNSANAKRDLSSAIRVHFDAYADEAPDNHLNRFVSKDGAEVATVGKLDLDGDNNDDKHYDVNDADQHAAMYGFGEHPENFGSDIYYGSADGITAPTADDYQKPYSVANALNVKLGSTSATDGKYLNVLVTIWIEGWQQLGKSSDDDANKSSIWDLVKTVDSKFDIGMQFEAKNAQ